MPIALVTLFYTTLSLIGNQQAELQTADEIMQRVRHATNFSLEKIPEAGLILEGKGTFNGVPSKIRVHFNRQGHFLQELDTVLGTTLSGYDGKEAWSKEVNGESDIMELSKRRQSLLAGALLSGLWISKSSGMTYTLVEKAPVADQHLLQFSHEPSQLMGTISIDKKSMLPQACTFTSADGDKLTITWKGTLSYEGMKWPRNIEIAVDAKKNSYQLESATAASKRDDNPFRLQISPPTNVTFDASKSALLEVKKAKSGVLLVRPLVNGKEVGWFILACGEEGNVLHARTAKKLGLETYGYGQTGSDDGSDKLSRPRSISLGRMTLQDPVVYVTEFPAYIDEASGVPIAGIIGQGTFRSSVIEIDYVTSQVALFDPKNYEQEQGKKNWQKLNVSKGLTVEAEFEGHKGVFSLTSAPARTAIIYSPAVKKLKLLEGRELKDTFIRGYGGEQIAKKGKLKYFEIGGHRHEDVEVSFGTSETGALSNQDVIGMIGIELIKPFQIVFDCQNRRIAFVKRGTQQAEPQTADEIMQRVRQAMNFSLEKIPEAGLILEGNATSDGTPGKFRMHFNRQGHFTQQGTSVLGSTLLGYDGKDVWSKAYDGETYLMELSDRRQSLLTGALFSGFWIDKSSGMTYTMSKDLALPDQYLLQFSHEPSQLTGTISIDKESMLPQKCKYISVKGEYVIVTWKETLSYEGVKLPRNIEFAAGVKTLGSYHWDSATAASKTSDNPFRAQISPPTNVTFDAGKAAQLEVKKTEAGNLLVRPLVNGKDVGWFQLSSGVAGNVLHVRTAKKLGLETYGEWEGGAVGGSVKANWSRPKTISLGRMTIQDPLVSNFELPANLDDGSGVPIAGIIGLGTFRCSVIEVDYVNSQVALFDPKIYEQERGKKNWQRLYVLSGLGVEAEFEGHKGVFSLTSSTGATVVIYSPAVKKLNLLEGRELKDTFIRGYGGREKAKVGKLKYFEIGGHRHEDVEAIFATSETGAFSNPDVIGMIGGELVKPFQIVFDYQNRRIAFVKRDANDERKALENAARSAYQSGKYQEAEAKCRQAIRASETANVEDQILADSLTLVGALEVVNGKYTQAETSLNRALAILKKTVGVDHESNTTALLALSALNMARGQYQEAEPLIQQALRILEKRSKENQNEIAAALINLGNLHHSQGNHQEADKHYLRAVDILEKVPNREEEYYALVKANLASLKVSQGKYQEAITLYQDALKILQDRFGNDYLYVGVLLGDLARVHGFLNQHETSDGLFEKSQSNKRKNKTQTELAEADLLVKRAKENITKGQLSQAEMSLWSALRSYERGLGPDSQKVNEVYGLLAKLKEAQGKENESSYYLKRAKQISDQIGKGLGK